MKEHWSVRRNTRMVLAKYPRTCHHLYRVSQKVERSIFVTLIVENILISSDKTLSSEKNDTKIIWFGSVVLILQPFFETQSFTVADPHLWNTARAIYDGESIIP